MKIMENNELYHHGVKGMKWGHRKARPRATSDGSALRSYKRAKANLRQAYGNKVIKDNDYDIAYGNSQKLKNQFGKNNRDNNAELVRTAEASAKADREYKAAKAAVKATKKMAKMEAKQVKKMYRDQYMKGENVLGKIWAYTTGVHNDYANYAYKKNKGAFNENYKW